MLFGLLITALLPILTETFFHRYLAIENSYLEYDKVSLSHIDALGGLTKLLSIFVTANKNFVPREHKDHCGTHIVAIAGTEMVITARPRGKCNYCCALKQPRHHISFYLSTNSIANIKIDMIRKFGYLKSYGVDSNLPTIIYIHGFTEHALGVSANGVRDAYLSRSEKYNILTLDWKGLASLPWYTVAVNNTRIVGKLLGKFLKFYDETGELPLRRVHIIGFSLGAHIAGFAGKFLGKRKISRITALDPAFPQFSLTDTNQRLSKFDADYIDVIHTDGGIYGFPISLGHADFYPNGGRFTQPGCSVSQLAEDSNIFAIVLCNHFRAWRFYAESVRNPTAFPATKCGIMENGKLKKCRFTTHGYMGYPTNQSTLGNFYLTTNGQSPFSKAVQNQNFPQDAIKLIL